MRSWLARVGRIGVWSKSDHGRIMVWGWRRRRAHRPGQHAPQPPAVVRLDADAAARFRQRLLGQRAFHRHVLLAGATRAF